MKQKLIRWAHKWVTHLYVKHVFLPELKDNISAIYPDMEIDAETSVEFVPAPELVEMIKSKGETRH